MNIFEQLLATMVMLCILFTIGLCDTCIGGAFACITIGTIIMIVAHIIGAW